MTLILDSGSKRKLQYDGEKRDEEIIKQLEPKQPRKDENDLWNQCHAQLIRDLEKKGTLWRYSHKHLKLWTDEIVEGRSYGIGEEPDWTAHIDKVVTPPKTSRGAAVSQQGQQGKWPIQNTHSFGQGYTENMFNTCMMSMMATTMTMLSQVKIKFTLIL